MELNSSYNCHYSLILRGCMNTHRVKAQLKNFWIWWDSRCRYMVEMTRLIKNIKPKEGAVIQWKIQVGNNSADLKVKLDLTLTEFI